MHGAIAGMSSSVAHASATGNATVNAFSILIVSLEDLVEAPLDAPRLLLDVLVVDIDDLQRLEVGRAFGGLNVDARRVAAVGREDLLCGVPDHELGEQL